MHLGSVLEIMMPVGLSWGVECLVGSFSTEIYEALSILFVVDEAIARSFRHAEIENACQRGKPSPYFKRVKLCMNRMKL